MSIRISAIVCTHNHATYLRKALQSLVAQTLPLEFFEIIIVDNGSEDGTRRVVEGFSEATNLRYLFEPVLGAARARNTGVQNAKGKFIAFLDDDAIADPNWLAQYLEAFEVLGTGVGLVGGRIEPIWEAPKPAWLSDKLLGIFSIYHYSDIPIVLNERQWLSACNLGCSREVFEAVGGLREDLDRKGKTLRASGEAALRKEVDARGLRSFYYPGIRVHHHIPTGKLTRRWFLKLAYWQGRSAAIMLNPASKPVPCLQRIYLTFKWTEWGILRLGLVLLAANAAERFRRQLQFVEAIGYISGLWLWE